KVLYEMMTGKDRFQFPELPCELPAGDQRKMWLEMNRLICDICEPKQSKRTITTAEELSEAVKRLQQGKKLRKNRAAMLIKFALFLLFFGGVAAGVFYWKLWWHIPSAIDPPVLAPSVVDTYVSIPGSRPKNDICAIKVITNPPYAHVSENGIELNEVTPTEFRNFEPGEVVTYRFELPGYRVLEKTYSVPDQEIFVVNEQLKVFRPPTEDDAWLGPLGVEYQPRDGFHISGFLRASNFQRYVQEAGVDEIAKNIPFSESGESIEIALLTEKQATKYIAWLEARARDAGLLELGQMMDFVQEPDLAATGYTALDRNKGILPTRCVVKKIAYGSILFSSDPVGARIYVDEQFVGVTPFKLGNMRPGSVKIELRADGYQQFKYSMHLADNEAFVLNTILKQNNGVIFGANWKNSLGLPMVPIRDGLMASVFETRVTDYDLFIQETKHRRFRNPGFRQGPSHPVVGVNRADAIEFCKWLTARERALAIISESHRYKIPSDLEWSELADFEEAPEQSPSERDHRAQSDQRLAHLYFWGTEFPPSNKVANIADEDAARAVGVSLSRTVGGYNDGFEKTAPVGSFPESSNGLHDLCGNVYEWVSTDYKEGAELAVVRGGSWASFTKNHLRVWSRFLMSKSTRGNQFGFRIILVDESTKAE
ncbi:MAG: SUMF1/EgtB/PvdO family nonheme iron enzyme, partial [Rubritalea sp.]|uniref:SUMF1/EgtB/PvdO family nonheme iron enzyme n=1 Tax=Rubritalea sp. TaxID=2109375 RepID=UPI003242A823